jgi:protein TonB
MTIKFRLFFIVLAVLTFSCGARKAQIGQKEKTIDQPVATEVPTENTLEERPAPVPPADRDEKEEIFVVVEDMPRFPGCEDIAGTNSDKRECANQKMLEYIYSNIQYPQEARKTGVEGICIVNFIVSKNGSIKNAKVLRDPGGGIGSEALRVVNSMNENGIRWIPGKQRGKAVDTRFNLPIKFSLP